MIYMPAAVVQHSGDHADPSRQIAVQSPAGQCMAPELSRQLDDVIGQPFFVWQTPGNLALRGTVLPDGAGGPRSDTPRVCRT